MELQKSLNKLYSLHTFGIKLGLDNIRMFLQHIGNPHMNLKMFHVAGSNGKGSTSAFIASILMELKYNAGLYTSPHFVKFNERIKINNSEIPDEYIASFISDYEDYIDKTGLTFFEVTTALAFKYFFDKKVDYAVIETGLGGRLDATNVIIPAASLITSISLEHTEILGNTVEKIAAEKAEIIKSKTKVFTGKLPPAALKIVENKCKETGSYLFNLEEYIVEKKGGVVELYTEEVEIDDWSIPLKGDYQKYNAALAGLCIAKTLGTDDSNFLLNGIRNVIQNTGIQGRYEYLKTEPGIILDSAHNPEGVKNFLGTFKKEKYKKKTLLFGVLKDKDVSEMLQCISGSFDEIRVTDIKNERACSSQELKLTADKLGIPVIIEKNPMEFIKKFAGGPKENCLVIFGSMYLLGEIKSFYNK